MKTVDSAKHFSIFDQSDPQDRNTFYSYKDRSQKNPTKGMLLPVFMP